MGRFKATAPGRIRAWIVPLPHVEFAVSHACGVVKHDAFQNTPEPFERVQQRLARAFCILLPRTGLAIIGFRTNQSVPHETIQNIGGNPKIVKVRAKACLLLSIFSTYSARMIKAGNQRGKLWFPARAFTRRASHHLFNGGICVSELRRIRFSNYPRKPS